MEHISGTHTQKSQNLIQEYSIKYISTLYKLGKVTYSLMHSVTIKSLVLGTTDTRMIKT